VPPQYSDVKRSVRKTGVRKENFFSRKMFLICTSGLHSDKEGSKSFYLFSTSTRAPADVLVQRRSCPVTMVKLQEKVSSVNC